MRCSPWLFLVDGTLRDLGYKRFSCSISCLSHKAIECSRHADETAKTEAPCHRRCGTMKIPSLATGISIRDISI